MHKSKFPAAAVRPLTPAQQQEVADAHGRARKLRSAAGVARFNAWSTGLLALCSIPFAWSSVSGLLVALGLGVVAYNEVRGRRLLLDFDSRGPVLLGWNQLGLLAGIVVYCGWMLATGLSDSSPWQAELAANPELGELLGSGAELDHLYHLLVVAVYGSVILLSVLYQGWNAWYYFSRRRVLATYLQSTAEWVRDLQRLTAPGHS